VVSQFSTFSQFSIFSHLLMSVKENKGKKLFNSREKGCYKKRWSAITLDKSYVIKSKPVVGFLKQVFHLGRKFHAWVESFIPG
jgi:hypothetical protein